MEEIVAIAERHAREHGASQIHRLALRVGSLSGVVPDALRFAFEAMCTDTLLRDANLDIEEVAVACWCAHCGIEFQPVDVVYACPRCAAISRDIRRGMEFEVASLEIS